MLQNIKIYLSKEPGYNYVENINSATNNFQKLFDENNKTIQFKLTDEAFKV